MKSVEEIVTDFDAIAKAIGAGPDRNVLSDAERDLLARIPSSARVAIDSLAHSARASRRVPRR